jgi:hypothetical protein
VPDLIAVLDENGRELLSVLIMEVLPQSILSRLK